MSATSRLTCPIPIARYPRILTAHGGGGSLTRSLIHDLFFAAFENPVLADEHDGAVLSQPAGRIALTTDSYVVSPLFFPGGNIGSLAVHGTVNDLAMCGARAVGLSVGFILEEGLEMDVLWRIALAMRRAADAAGVQIVTGDTKVVEKGKGDGVFINTAGVGELKHQRVIAPRSIREGDAVILSGDVGRHGVAILSAREGIAFETPVESDSALLCEPALALVDEGIDVHCMRDLTRGGLAAALIEISDTARRAIHIDEATIPVVEGVRGACEVLGLDPFYVANEGRFVAVVGGANADRAVEILQRIEVSSGSRCIGQVRAGAARVTMTGRIGVERILDLFSGEQLPRIC